MPVPEHPDRAASSDWKFLTLLYLHTGTRIAINYWNTPFFTNREHMHCSGKRYGYP